MPTKVLQPYYMMFRNRFRFKEQSRNSVRRDVLMIVVTLIIMFCIFFGFVMILGSLQNNPLIREAVPIKIIELLFYAFFVLLLISNTIAAAGNVYSAQNLDLLLTTPVSNLRLYFAKLCEMLIETSLMFVIFIAPVGFAYAYCLPLRPGLLWGALVVVIPFLLLPAGISVMFATIFMRFASLVWRRGLFLFLCLTFLAVYALLSLLGMLKQIQLERGGANAIVQLIGLFDNPNPVWLPSRWAADILGYYVTGQSANAGLEITLLWSCAFGSLALGYLAFDYFLLPVRSLAGMHHRPNENGMMKRRKRDIFRTLFEFVYHRVPLDEQFRAIILKDLTSVVRDRAQALQLLIYLGIAVVALVILEFMSSALNLSFIGQRSWWAFLASCNVLFTGFVITALMTRLVYPSISLEGKAFWIMITAPIDMERLIKAKFLCWLPFIMFIASVLLVSGVVAIYATWELMLASVLVGLCLSIGCTGLAVGIGSIFASFEWESPTQIATGFGTLVLLLASLALVVIIFMPASTLMFMCTILEPRAVVGEMLAPFGKAMMVLLIFLINFLVASFSCRKGVESLSLRRA